MVKITTRQQFDLLIREMEAKPNIARGVRAFGETKATVEKWWVEISEKLNSCGPPMRTPDEWQRVWIHFKAKLKKKMAQNKRSLYVTVGGPSQEVSLSSLEQAASALLHFDVTINPDGDTFGTIPNEFAQELENAEILDGTQNNAKTNQPEQIKHTQTPKKAMQQPKKPITAEEKRFNLLEEQTRTQSELLHTLNKIEKHLYKKNQILKDLKELKAKKLEVLKKMKDIKQKKYEHLLEDHILNKEIKQKKLQILEAQLNSLSN